MRWLALALALAFPAATMTVLGTAGGIAAQAVTVASQQAEGSTNRPRTVKVRPPDPSKVARADIPPRMLRLYRSAGRDYGLSWTALAAVGKAESNHCRVAGARRGGSSSAGALGCMQFMPGTWTRWGRGGDIYDSADSVPAAARLLVALGARTRLDLAAAAYNAGPGAVRRYGGVPPYPETKGYVARVLSWNHVYAKH